MTIERGFGQILKPSPNLDSSILPSCARYPRADLAGKDESAFLPLSSNLIAKACSSVLDNITQRANEEVKHPHSKIVSLLVCTYSTLWQWVKGVCSLVQSQQICTCNTKAVWLFFSETPEGGFLHSSGFDLKVEEKERKKYENGDLCSNVPWTSAFFVNEAVLKKTDPRPQTWSENLVIHDWYPANLNNHLRNPEQILHMNG